VRRDQAEQARARGYGYVVGGSSAAFQITLVIEPDLPLADGSRLADRIEWFMLEDRERERLRVSAEATALDCRRGDIGRELGPLTLHLAAVWGWLLEFANPAEQRAATVAKAEHARLEQQAIDQELRRIDALRTRAAITAHRAEAERLERALTELEAHDHAR
jgi:hypothetical protein